MNDFVPVSFVYIDANPFIYLIEGSETLAAPIRDLFARLRSRPGSAVTSELALAEVLPKAPTADHRRAYLDLIARSGMIDLQPVSRDILIETATYRRMSATVLPDGRQVMPKLPDSIHVVTAIKSGCTRLLSTDGGLRVPTGISRFEANGDGIAALLQELT